MTQLHFFCTFVTTLTFNTEGCAKLGLVFILYVNIFYRCLQRIAPYKLAFSIVILKTTTICNEYKLTGNHFVILCCSYKLKCTIFIEKIKQFV